eukprot:3354755-Ditylum_brightwellii.AAC.1
MSSKHDQVTSMTFVRSQHNQNLSQQGSDSDLLRRCRQKHSTINLLRVNEEGDETLEEGFDRDSDGHDGDKHDGGGDDHGGDGDNHDGDGHGGDGSHSTPRS